MAPQGRGTTEDWRDHAGSHEHQRRRRASAGTVGAGAADGRGPHRGGAGRDRGGGLRLDRREDRGQRRRRRHHHRQGQRRGRRHADDRDAERPREPGPRHRGQREQRLLRPRLRPAHRAGARRQLQAGPGDELEVRGRQQELQHHAARRRQVQRRHAARRPGRQDLARPRHEAAGRSRAHLPVQPHVGHGQGPAERGVEVQGAHAAAGADVQPAAGDGHDREPQGRGRQDAGDADRRRRALHARQGAKRHGRPLHLRPEPTTGTSRPSTTSRSS
jgi:hypothetical protein